MSQTHFGVGEQSDWASGRYYRRDTVPRDYRGTNLTYFEKRNAHFRQHPRRAGKKIWGKERQLAAFSEANNCKDPRYR